MKNLDIIELLKIELQRRIGFNSKYSLRAFARDIGINPGTLAHILKRQRNPDKGTREKIYLALKLSKENQRMLEKNAKGSIYRFKEIDEEILLYLSDWYYDAIVELIRIKGFKSQVDYIASKLGLENIIVKQAIERMINLKVIKRMPNNALTSENENTLVYGDDNTSVLHQRIQIQLLEKAVLAIEEVPKKNREQASMTMAINKRDLTEAKKRIKKFHHELCEYLQRPNRHADAVYQLLTSFYPLTK